MKVILVSDVYRLGHVGDICEVRAGYAKNYLIPFGYALVATSNNLKNLETTVANAKKKNSENRSGASTASTKLNGSVLTFICQASDDGVLYGSIRPKAIAEQCTQITGFNVSASSIDVISIKSVGLYSAKVRLFGNDIFTNISINVARTEAEAEMNLKKASTEPQKEQES